MSSEVKMRQMLCILMVVAAGLGAQSSPSEAERTWAMIIDAKGGARKLEAVRSLVVEVAVGFKNFTAKDVAPGERSTTVYVFPDRFWAFTDYRPGKLGAMATVWNGHLNHVWVFSDGQKALDLDLRPNSTAYLEGAEQTQYVYLLQSHWVKPKPVSVDRTRERVLLRAQWADWTLTYRIDPATNLPSSLDAQREVPILREPDKPMRQHKHWEFDAYNTVGGVQLPARIRFGSDWGTAAFQINVDVNPTLFEQAPSAVTSADAWKASLRSGGR